MFHQPADIRRRHFDIAGNVLEPTFDGTDHAKLLAIAVREAEAWLSAREARFDAVHGAFGVPAGMVLDGSPVLLVDDRVDTGWTLTEATRVLREGGAGPVLPLVLAVDA